MAPSFKSPALRSPLPHTYRKADNNNNHNINNNTTLPDTSNTTTYTNTSTTNTSNDHHTLSDLMEGIELNITHEVQNTDQSVNEDSDNHVTDQYGNTSEANIDKVDSQGETQIWEKMGHSNESDSDEE
jgi:hypothetical protein